MKKGKELISDERDRQLSVECWNDEHDDEYTQGELLSAAAVYMAATCPFSNGLEDVLWPWDAEWFKPGKPVDKIRCLTKAGALIAAEIDRLQRHGKSK